MKRSCSSGDFSPSRWTQGPGRFRMPPAPPWAFGAPSGCTTFGLGLNSSWFGGCVAGCPPLLLLGVFGLGPCWPLAPLVLAPPPFAADPVPPAFALPVPAAPAPLLLGCLFP